MEVKCPGSENPREISAAYSRCELAARRSKLAAPERWLSADGERSAPVLHLWNSHPDLMKQTFVTFVRTTVVLGVVLLLPILAMPNVLDRLETMLYGSGQTTIQTALSQRPNGTEFHTSPPGVPRLSMTAEPEWDASMLRRPPVDPNPTLTAPPAVYRGDIVSNGKYSPGEIYASSSQASSLQASTPVAETDQLAAIQERLQALGAQYLRLEQVSAEPPLFRFVCHVELPGNTAYSRPFEAVAESPVKAALAIVAEVESWRAEPSAK